MANRITTLFDFKEQGNGLKRIKTSITEADGAIGKFKAGVRGALDEFKNNKGAQAAMAGVIFMLGKQAVGAASDLEESIAAVEGTFGELGDEILTIGEKSAESFGMSQRAFYDFSVRFAGFAKQIADRDGRSVVDVTEEMAGRVADFASRYNISMEEAAKVAQSTLAGETESFRRFGGDVSAATVKITAYKHGIADVGDELTESEKVLARYVAFMEQTDNVAGDFARTSDGLANSQRTLAANVENLAAAYGKELAPAVADVVQNINDLTEVAGGAENIVGVLKNTAPIKMLNDYNSAVIDFIGLGGDAEKQGNEFTDAIVRNMRETVSAKFATQRWYETLRQSTQETTYNADANEEMGLIQRATTGFVDAATEAQRRFMESIKHSRDEVGKLKRDIDDEQAWLNLQNSIDGTIAKMNDGEVSARDQRLAVLDLKEEVLDYAESINLPDRVVTQLLAQIEDGKVAEVEALLARWGGGVTVPIRPRVINTGGGSRIRVDEFGNVRSFHDGGVVPGPRGSEQLAVLKAGETVLPTHKSSGGGSSSAAGGGALDLSDATIRKLAAVMMAGASGAIATHDAALAQQLRQGVRG